MTENTTALLRLMMWLSPAFPVGAYSYSHGLERAVHDGAVGNVASLEAWVSALLEFGSLWNDGVLAAAAMNSHRDAEALRELAELGEALAGSAERHMETMNQGKAFAAAARAYGGTLENAPFPVAYGVLAARSGIETETAIAAYLQAFVTNQAQAAIRVGIIGQTQAVEMIARLEGHVRLIARRAASSSLDDLGGAAIMAEITAMAHETQETRLFRT